LQFTKKYQKNEIHTKLAPREVVSYNFANASQRLFYKSFLKLHCLESFFTHNKSVFHERALDQKAFYSKEF
jgi:hypothetical protein